jgi:ribose 5-phosphate isomerase
MDDRERYKQLVGAYAADMVPSNSVIGLGTGSTATYFVTAVAERLRDWPPHQCHWRAHI